MRKKLASQTYRAKRLFILASVFALMLAKANAADWKPITANDPTNEFDASRTSIIKPGVVSTWRKYVISDSSLPMYAFSITRWEIDCIKMQHRLMAIFEYNTSGQTIQSFIYDKDRNFREIPPDSSGDVVAQNLCSKYVKNKK